MVEPVSVRGRQNIPKTRHALPVAVDDGAHRRCATMTGRDVGCSVEGGDTIGECAQERGCQPTLGCQSIKKTVLIEATHHHQPVNRIAAIGQAQPAIAPPIDALHTKIKLRRGPPV